MSRGCLPSLPSSLKPWLAAGAMLCGLLGYHLLLLPPAVKTGLPSECPQPCCALRLQAAAASRSVFPIASSVSK